MFLKTKKNPSSTGKRDSIPSVITRDIHILGNIVSDGVIDIDGTVDGNIRCVTLTVRQHANIKGEVTAENVLVYGKINGLIKAKHVHLYSSCHIEGIVMHESLTIEDGAFVDGKCKRTDKPLASEQTDNEDANFDDAPRLEPKILENIRLIR